MRVIILFATALCTLLLAGCGPRISCTPVRVDGELAFQLEQSGANGFLDLTVWEKDSRQLLWAVGFNYLRGGRLRYGDRSNNGSAEPPAPQSYPASGLPPPIPTGKDIIVAVTYQYDEFISPAMDTACFVFRLATDGAPIDLRRIEYQEAPAK